MAPCCTRVKFALFIWVLAFAVTFTLVIIALATSSWMIWTDTLTKLETERGLFYTKEREQTSCYEDDLIRRTQDNMYSLFDVHAVAGLLIAGAVVDVITFCFGLFYFYIRDNEKKKLWTIYIPTSVAALTTAALVLIGCLVFLMDLDDVTETTMPVERDAACTAHVSGVFVLVDHYWSFYLALITGALSCIKGLLFILLAACKC
ncbi:hypothetical protein Btru_040846 [Bulinus truncatus]|nr:hypothetical protein Btru_040846 [Bulinus truncatus]